MRASAQATARLRTPLLSVHDVAGASLKTPLDHSGQSTAMPLRRPVARDTYNCSRRRRAGQGSPAILCAIRFPRGARDASGRVRMHLSEATGSFARAVCERTINEIKAPPPPEV